MGFLNLFKVFSQPLPLQYKLLAIIVAAVAVFGYGYMKGLTHTENKYEARLSKQEAQQERAYNALLQKKTKIEVQVITEYKDRIVEVEKWRTKNVEVIKYVPDVTVVFSNGWVYTHDSAIMRASAIDPSRVSDATPSGVTAPEALETVIDNYAICYKNTEQLLALQSWVRQISSMPK